jgi:hypothetical protein
MSGYLRQGRSNAARKIEAVPVVCTFVSPAEVAQVIREQDPFGLAHACRNAGGHVPINAGGAIACFHCSRIFWP